MTYILEISHVIRQSIENEDIEFVSTVAGRVPATGRPWAVDTRVAINQIKAGAYVFATRLPTPPQAGGLLGVVRKLVPAPSHTEVHITNWNGREILSTNKYGGYGNLLLILPPITDEWNKYWGSLPFG
jgi:hypothetical protein